MYVREKTGVQSNHKRDGYVMKEPPLDPTYQRDGDVSTPNEDDQTFTGVSTGNILQ